MANDFSLVAPVGLKCEYKTNPTGIDEKHPRFSWITKYEGCNSFQTAYRIMIASSIKKLLIKEGDVWDSGKVTSSESALIKFTDTPLHSNRTYFWQTMIWDEKDEASSWSEPAEFSTGLFEQDDWKAEWISHIYNEEPKKSIGFQYGIDKWIWYPFNSLDDKFRTIVLLKTFELDRISEIDSANLIVTADEKFKLYLNEKLIAESDDKIFSWARPVSIEIRELLNEGREPVPGTWAKLLC